MQLAVILAVRVACEASAEAAVLVAFVAVFAAFAVRFFLLEKRGEKLIGFCGMVLGLAP